jgi:DNA modification methylase
MTAPRRSTRRPARVATPHLVSDLIADPENRRLHTERNLAMITDALRTIGPARSIVIDERGQILAGNGVTTAAAQAGITKVRVIAARPDELIAVQRADLTADQKRALALYDNRSAELAEWNVEQLAADRAGQLEFTPFWTMEELAALLKDPPKAGLTEPDAVPPPRATAIVRGDLFALGPHRLLCGDATAEADVARLCGTVVPSLMVTDPPYGVDYDPDWRNRARRTGRMGALGASATGQVANDDRADWRQAWTLFRGTVSYVWHSALHARVVAESLVAAEFEIRAQIIWGKQHAVISRGHYHWQHEPCWYAVRKGTAAQWSGDRKQTTLWAIANANAFGGDAKEDATGHGTQKPVECMARPMRNHGAKGDTVYDPFVGSGTSLIAAEQLERRCLAMDLTPTYVQMAIDRWEAFTGLKATKVGEPVRIRRRRGSKAAM